MKKLILVRHGQTKWNAANRVQGWKDSQLTPKGLRQTKQVAKMLANEPIDIAYSSDMGRAFKTAKTITKPHGLKVHKLKALREISYGFVEGKNRAEIDVKFPGIWQMRAANPFTYRIKGGETFRDLQKRVEVALKKILSNKRHKNILIVGHANPNRVIIGKLLGIRDREMLGIRVAHDIVYFIGLNRKRTLHHKKIGGRFIRGYEHLHGHKVDLTP